MIILQEIGTEQTFSFIPRSQTYDGLFLRDEQTNNFKQYTGRLLRYYLGNVQLEAEPLLYT